MSMPKCIFSLQSEQEGTKEAENNGKRQRRFNIKLSKLEKMCVGRNIGDLSYENTRIY